MSYVSVAFFLFFSVTVALYFITPIKFRQYVLLIASLVFYAINSKLGTVYIAVTAVSVYFLGIAVDRLNLKTKSISKDIDKEEKSRIKKVYKNKKRGLVWIACIFNLGILLVLKYSGFFISTFSSILNVFGSTSEITGITFILPLGISYYTLMAISYIVDIYRARISADKNFARLLLYLVFFPCILEGPISTYSQLSSQLFEGHKFDKTNFVIGCQKVVWGLFKKMVIADRAAIVVNGVFDDCQNYHGSSILIAVTLYTIQIYCEFSGCIDIVAGVSKILGIDLPENFRQPFFSKSIQEFWRRWHITLGAWLREYVFYSISFSKGVKKYSKWTKKHIRNTYFQTSLPQMLSLLPVWLVMGLWHGASWKYVVYGLYYFILISIGIVAEPLIEVILKKLKINREGKLYSLFKTLRTDCLVVFGLMLFRADTLSDALHIFTSLFRGFDISIGACLSIGVTLLDFFIVFVGVAVVFIVSSIEQAGQNIHEKLLALSAARRYLIYFLFILSIAFFGIYGPSYTMQPFTYGMF